MGGKKIPSRQSQSNPVNSPEEKKNNDEKRFVNLLHIYTIYKQRFRRINKEEYEQLLRSSKHSNKQAPIELCKALMKSKQIPDIVAFEKNIGYLSVPRLLPLIALVAERSGYQIRPALVDKVNFVNTPQRFQEKFSHLMVYGFWFLGRVISDSLSPKDQINRGNTFNFSKGDMGFWWAGVRILDWVSYINKVNKDKLKIDCYSFVIQDLPKYRFYTNSALFNMSKHPLYFLSEIDWQNYTNTIGTIRHKLVPSLKIKVINSKDIFGNVSSCSDYISPSWDDDDDCSNSVISTISSEPSFTTLASRESLD